MVWLADIALDLPALKHGKMRLGLANEGEIAALAQVGSAGQTVCLCCHGFPARLVLEPGLAADLVRAVLGVPDVLGGGAGLSRIERGILDALVAEALNRFGFGPELRLQSSVDESLTAAPTTWVLSTAVGGRAGRAYLQAGQDFVQRALASWRSLEGPIVGRVVLARTTVPATAMAGAEVGDTVVFDGVPELAGRPSWPAQVWIGGLDLPAVIGPDGAIGLNGTPEPEGCAQAGDADGDPVVVACLGELAAEDLAALVCGQTVKIDRSAPIDLRQARAPWAEGRLCALGGSLAVQISRRFRG